MEDELRVGPADGDGVGVGGVRDMGWPSDTTTSCASTISTLKSDIIEAWKRRKKKNHRKEGWKCHKMRRQLKLDQLKPVPHRLKPD
jgi:hypothetical protein